MKSVHQKRGVNLGIVSSFKALSPTTYVVSSFKALSPATPYPQGARLGQVHQVKRLMYSQRVSLIFVQVRTLV